MSLEQLLLSCMIVIVITMTCYAVYLRRKIARTNYDAEHDVLTGILNRSGFMKIAEKLIRNMREEDPLAILFFNIKGFKVINELFGIDGGDQVLQESTELLQHSKLKPLAVSRFESDHFVCLLRQADLDYDELAKLCHRIYVQDNKQFNFYGRCGIYLVQDKSTNVSGMCDRAKLAKESIRDDFAKPYAIYDKRMRDDFVAKKELTSELTRALNESELEVYYQPIFDTKTKKPVSAEALVRWQHPKRGLLSPGTFIPIFEENGYISELDLFVANCSTEFLQSRIEQNKFVVPIAVNLSRMDFYDVKLMDVLLSNIKNAQLPTGLSRIEITESAYSTLVEHNSNILNTIKKQGIKILLDDFGSGYSSFSSIRDFDFDIIKLDMGFVRQIESSEKTRRIISSMIEMAHDIGGKVVAEGVETQSQADFLGSAGCDYIQGYLYSKPLSEENFEKLLDRN